MAVFQSSLDVRRLAAFASAPLLHLPLCCCCLLLLQRAQGYHIRRSRNGCNYVTAEACMWPARRALLQKPGLPSLFTTRFLSPLRPQLTVSTPSFSRLLGFAVSTNVRLVLLVAVPSISLLPDAHTQHVLRTTRGAGKRDSVGDPLKINVLPSSPHCTSPINHSTSNGPLGPRPYLTCIPAGRGRGLL